MGTHNMKILPLICYNNKKAKQQLFMQELHTDCVALEAHCHGLPNSVYNHAVIVTVFAVISLLQNSFMTSLTTIIEKHLVQRYTKPGLINHYKQNMLATYVRCLASFKNKTIPTQQRYCCHGCNNLHCLQSTSHCWHYAEKQYIH